MARSNITSTSVSDGSDNGSVEISIIDGEQTHRQVTLDWITDLADYNIFIRIIEAENDGVGTAPTRVKEGGVVQVLSRSNGLIRDVSLNGFKFVIPWNLAKTYSPRPSPASPVYAFFELEIGEPGTGDDVEPIADSALPSLQVWKPLRGLISVGYSPTEG